ncbi:MAG: indolepyruvate ferredoxin oxidoreductase subunit alpha [archaeon]
MGGQLFMGGEDSALLLGDEAVALAALHAGASISASYPGTPATEINEFVRLLNDAEGLGVHCKWSPNEKVAYEKALGASIAGARAMVSMKLVGLNVAMDVLMNSAITGVNGGLLVVVADDPGMHSSQNEQDSRELARFANIPCFEPRDQQGAYDYTRMGFDLSEEYNLPVMLRITTRLAHSRSEVVPHTPLERTNFPVAERGRAMLLPHVSRQRHKDLVERVMPDLTALVNHAPYAVSENDALGPLGVISAGIAANYVEENFNQSPYPHMALTVVNPLPDQRIKDFALRLIGNKVYNLLVVEEGYPYIEDGVRNILRDFSGFNIYGKLTGHLPRTGELKPEFVREALGLDPLPNAGIEVPAELLKGRPPRLCTGCPHESTYKVLNAVKKQVDIPIVTSDIGCYTLGYLPPLNAIDTCVEMGASIGMALGAAEAGLEHVVAVIGDSTYTHSGMPCLLEAADGNLPITVIILDNNTVAMTGFQPTYLHGDDLVRNVIGMGVSPEHVKTMKARPSSHEDNVKILRDEVEYKGTSVVIAEGPCIHAARKSL